MAQHTGASFESSCLGKRPYQTARQAKRVARRATQNPGTGRIVKYRCPFCGAWHIGHARRRPEATR